MVKVTKMCSGTVWYNSFCWNVSHCVVLYLCILYMGFCGNGYHPFSKWMILFRGLNCPSSISFVEVSERGLWRYPRAHILCCALENEQKALEEQFEPTGQLLLSNEPWACFSSCKCLLNKISWGLMVYGGVEYTYRYKHFCINIRRILLWKSCFVQ